MKVLKNAMLLTIISVFVVSISACGGSHHTYGKPDFIWSDDDSSCVAVFSCEDGDDKQEISCTIEQSETDTEITYEAKAEFENNTYTDEKDVQKVLSSTDIAEYAKPRTVTVQASFNNGSGSGSGFFIDNQGTLVTNYHVIDGCTALSVDVADGGNYSVDTIVDFDETHDLAILKITYNSEYFEECREVNQGETVYTIGSSLGELTGSFNQGILSSTDRTVGVTSCYQMDAAISQGNSGGPLLNDRGEVIGINSYSTTKGDSNNFAIKIQELDQMQRDKNYTISEYREWYSKETSRSYSPYTYDNNGIPQTFYYSTVNTYQQITGTSCKVSGYYSNGEKKSTSGYRDCSYVYVYEYNTQKFDQYTEYLESRGFEYDSESSKDNSYCYEDSFDGISIIIVINTENNLILISPTKS